MERALTDRQPKLSTPSGMSRKAIPEQTRAGTDRRTAEAISLGVQFILAQQQEHRWMELRGQNGVPDRWVTAYVLARLGDLPAGCFRSSQQQQIASALEWLLQARSIEGVWSSAAGAPVDAESTAWAVIALRQHGRTVPRSVLDWLQRCRCAGGGFAVRPRTEMESSDLEGCDCATRPATTALAVKALGDLDSSTEDYLAAQLTMPATAQAGNSSARFYICSEILDCDAALAPWSRLNRVCQLTALESPETSFDVALLLRCLSRLRMRRARSVADSLLARQRQDGSWPGTPVLGPALHGVRSAHQAVLDQSGLLATATAVSALMLGEGQPGLFFGSDLPRPRRLF
jgi:hypothetical protein